jgi:hypothetical protein
MPFLTDYEQSKKFVYEFEWSDKLKYMHKCCLDLFSQLPYIYTQKPETNFFIEHIKPKYGLYDVDKPIIQTVTVTNIQGYELFEEILTDLDLQLTIKYFQSDPTVPAFKNSEHLFFGHRHHTGTSVAALIFPITGCDEDTVTSFSTYEDVDGYIPNDPSIGLYWSEYYWKTYNKNDPKYLLSDDEAQCRYVLKDKPVLWNVKQFHEAINRGTKHRTIANINFNSRSMTWEETIEMVKNKCY